MSAPKPFSVSPDIADQTLAAALRHWLPDLSWSQARQHIAARRVRLNGQLILEPARRAREGDTVELLGHSAPKPRQENAVVLRHLDEHLVAAEKPAGIPTVRHPAGRNWTPRRHALAPTLE